MASKASISAGISRRTLLTGAAVGVSTFSILRNPANAAEFTYKLGHDNPATHPCNVRALEAAANIEKESGGRLVIQVFPNNQLGGDTQMLSQLRSGALELLMVGDNIMANVVPAANIVDMPFAYSGYQQLWQTLDGPFGKFIHGEIEKVGLHAFDKGWDIGFRHVFTTDHPVKTAEDIRGLKLRVPQAPVQIALFKALGASPTPVNNSELYTALQTHLVDGAEQPLSSIETSRYYEICKYVSLTNHMPTSFEMMANGNAWRRLPNDLQEILSRNLDAAAERDREHFVKAETELVTTLEGQGQTVIQPDRESFKEMVQKAGLYAQWRDAYGVKPFELLEESVGKLA